LIVNSEVKENLLLPVGLGRIGHNAEKTKDCRELERMTRGRFSFTCSGVLCLWSSRWPGELTSSFFPAISHLRHLIVYTKAVFFVTDRAAPYSWSEEEIADLHDHCTVIMASDGRKI